MPYYGNETRKKYHGAAIKTQAKTRTESAASKLLHQVERNDSIFF